MARGYEIRINSVQDAKSAVQHSAVIQARADALKCTHIEFHVASELESTMKPMLNGMYKFKVFWKVIRPQPDNLLCILPQFIDFKKVRAAEEKAKAKALAQIAVAPEGAKAPKKVGWPKGKPRKPRAIVDQPPQQAAA